MKKYPFYSEGQNYPVVHYQQWSDDKFIQEYSKVDIGIYYLRSSATLCCENQLMWACLKSCDNCVSLRQDRYENEHHLSFNHCPGRI